MLINRGDIFYADLEPTIGSEQGGQRPVLIIQNDKGNRHSPTVICAPISSKMNKLYFPTHVEIPLGLVKGKKSFVMLEQIRTIDKQRIGDKLHKLDIKTMREIDNALRISLALR